MFKAAETTCEWDNHEFSGGRSQFTKWELLENGRLNSVRLTGRLKPALSPVAMYSMRLG